VDHARLEDFVSRVRGVGRTEELDVAAAEALDAFDAAGVPSLLLKGAALSRFLYAAEQQRGYSDVDLLVAPDHLAAARRALSALGYTNTTALRGVEDIAGALHAETWVRRNQAIGPLMIDLHARLPGVNAPPELAWQILASRQVTVELGGRHASVLPREGLALHVATHAAQHGPDDPRPLADLRSALERWPRTAWEDAAQLAGDLQAVAAFAAGLRLVPAGARLASLLELPRTDDIEWEMRHRGVRPRGTFHLQALVEARGVRERAQLLRRSLLPKREWIVWEDPRAARGGVPLVRARVRHILRVPVWGLSALLYRRRRRRAAHGAPTD
jgi:hypothetical protein